LSSEITWDPAGLRIIQVVKAHQSLVAGRTDQRHGATWKQRLQLIIRKREHVGMAAATARGLGIVKPPIRQMPTIWRSEAPPPWMMFI
jgi:hypothetical protein